MSDLISRQAAIDALWKAMYEYEDKMEKQFIESDDLDIEEWILHRIFVQNMSDIDRKAILDLPSAQPETQWIPCSERMPERIINDDVETVQEFFVTVKERWQGEEWEYHTDVAEFLGDYIDDLWQTYNDWREGQEVHVIAWLPLPEPYKEENE